MSQAAEPSPDPEFHQFCQDYRPRLLRFVRKAARTDDLPEARLDTEGVVQDTFMAAFEQWATIEHPERWIYTVAARNVRKHSRQEWYQDRKLRERLHGVCHHESDEDPVHTQAVASRIVERILTLPTNQRIATYLCRVEGWKAAEIAELLNIAPATAYVHIHEGTLKVRRSERVIIDHSGTAAWRPDQSFPMPVEFDHRPVRRTRTRRLVALAALLIIVGLGWVYPQLPPRVVILLVVGVTMAWIMASACQAMWRLLRRRHRN